MYAAGNDKSELLGWGIAEAVASELWLPVDWKRRGPQVRGLSGLWQRVLMELIAVAGMIIGNVFP